MGCGASNENNGSDNPSPGGEGGNDKDNDFAKGGVKNKEDGDKNKKSEKNEELERKQEEDLERIREEEELRLKREAAREMFRNRPKQAEEKKDALKNFRLRVKETKPGMDNLIRLFEEEVYNYEFLAATGLNSEQLSLVLAEDLTDFALAAAKKEAAQQGQIIGFVFKWCRTFDDRKRIEATPSFPLLIETCFPGFKYVFKGATFVKGEDGKESPIEESISTAGKKATQDASQPERKKAASDEKKLYDWYRSKLQELEFTPESEANKFLNTVVFFAEDLAVVREVEALARTVTKTAGEAEIKDLNHKFGDGRLKLRRLFKEHEDPLRPAILAKEAIQRMVRYWKPQYTSVSKAIVLLAQFYAFANDDRGLQGFERMWIRVARLFADVYEWTEHEGVSKELNRFMAAHNRAVIIIGRLGRQDVLKIFAKTDRIMNLKIAYEQGNKWHFPDANKFAFNDVWKPQFFPSDYSGTKI
mmetsp:Transcript_9041/g.14419  ORF Transcript_9041/g.14419 Transcript_9041/m.14419 type:complete len:473 (-) Transcript_9041:392-1810(-)